MRITTAGLVNTPFDQPITYHYLPAYGYSAYISGMGPVLKIETDDSLDQSASDTVLQFKISEIGYSTSTSWKNGLLGLDVFPELPEGLDVYLERLTTPTRATLELQSVNKTFVKLPITLIPCWHWPHSREARISVAAHVLPGEEMIQRIANAASATYTKKTGSSPLSDLIGAGKPDAARTSMKAVYDWLIENTSIAYDAPRPVFDEWCKASYQEIRPPHRLITHPWELQGAANCLDMTVFLASVLEALGLKPLVFFTGGIEEAPNHGFLGCWRERTHRFRPILTGHRALKERVERGEILVLESTGVCQGPRRLDFEAAQKRSQDFFNKTDEIHAVDIAAARPPYGAVRPMLIPDEPVVRQAYGQARDLADEFALKHGETIHILYGLCAAKGEITSWLMASCGSSAENVREIIARHLPRGKSGGKGAVSRKDTRNAEICRNTARSNARIAGSSVVRESDLLWAILENPSRNVGRILEAAGCPHLVAIETLHRRFRRPGEMTESRTLRSATDLGRESEQDPGPEADQEERR
ncbi:MAG: hypothetical protein KJ970_16825 [Candidatus Eisenbacteria bacterium]|uniref:Clp R domain-containing protein n=1 Tax=Eiseniibacteriota bacterium TaxID=2212470 RepID=A0A948RXB9_UNCEI|nr:hypothetical protein [Candidatus Eisenbacteria bacterium]MBU1948107.1 hypothetical protein [Candidatus Eisenbacteria bacterium]MBU2692580.1 hypothetical protein [Candidatus Eisenbacteria bacterium]